MSCKNVELKLKREIISFHTGVVAQGPRSWPWTTRTGVRIPVPPDKMRKPRLEARPLPIQTGTPPKCIKKNTAGIKTFRTVVTATVAYFDIIDHFTIWIENRYSMTGTFADFFYFRHIILGVSC